MTWMSRAAAAIHLAGNIEGASETSFFWEGSMPVRTSELHPGPERPSAGQDAAGLTISTGPRGLPELRSGVSRPGDRPGVCPGICPAGTP